MRGKQARPGGTGGVNAAANKDTIGGELRGRNSVGTRSGGTGGVEAAANWKALTRAWEGTCHTTIVDRHLACGHSCTANKDCHKYTLPLTPEQIDAIFDADWAEAERRSMEHLSVKRGPIVSACFRYGCAQFETIMELFDHLLANPDDRNRATAKAIQEGE